MEIVGIGTDIVECVRIGRMIEQHGEMFLTRVYTPREIRDCQSRKNTTGHFSARWAAKEAILKALGTSRGKGMSWTDIEVRSEPNGSHRVYLFGAAREHADQLRVTNILISMSHCRAYATGYAMAVRDGQMSLPAEDWE